MYIIYLKPIDSHAFIDVVLITLVDYPSVPTCRDFALIPILTSGDFSLYFKIFLNKKVLLGNKKESSIFKLRIIFNITIQKIERRNKYYGNSFNGWRNV